MQAREGLPCLHVTLRGCGSRYSSTRCATDAEDLEGTLGALAEAGAREVELAGLYGREPSELRRTLDAAGLETCSAHVPPERFERELEAVLDEARTLGNPSDDPVDDVKRSLATLREVV